jgi:hypothetical protein
MRRKMKKPITYFLVTAAILGISSQALLAVPLEVNGDSSLEGIATSNHIPLAAGFYEIGWLQAGITEADVTTAFSLGNLAQIDTWFNQVVSFAWNNSANDGSTNSFGTGMVFKNTVVADSVPADNAAFLDYKANIAGKTMFGWIRDAQDLGATSEMAFIQGADVFPTANDTIGFTDFADTFATDNMVISNANVWVGEIASVVNGGAVDTNDGSPADGLGVYNENTVLQLAGPQVIPEPSSATLMLLGSLLLCRRRLAGRRRS